MGGGDPPVKTQKYRDSQQYWSGSPEKLQRYQASILCWANIGPPERRADEGPFIVIFGSSIPS